MTPEILFKNLNSFKNSDISSLKEALKTAIRCSFAEKFAQGDERPCENNDFSESKKYNEANILFLWSIFEDLVETGYLCGEKIAVCMDKNLLALILIICGENVDLKPWNTEKTVESCKLILCIILKLFNCCDVSSLVGF